MPLGLHLEGREGVSARKGMHGDGEGVVKVAEKKLLLGGSRGASPPGSPEILGIHKSESGSKMQGN